MNRTARSFALALLAGALWIGWIAEHEHTSIRAPWTGLTLVASGVVFIAAGVVGRGWRTLASPVIVVPVAVVLTDLLVLPNVDVDEPFVPSCDPGCIPGWFFVLTRDDHCFAAGRDRHPAQAGRMDAPPRSRSRRYAVATRFSDLPSVVEPV